MTNLEKESHEKIKNMESSISSESVPKNIKKIKSKELFDEKKYSSDKKTQNKDITSNEYYFLFWN